MAKYACLTTNDSQCKRTAFVNPKDNTKYCWPHQNCETPIKKPKILSEIMEVLNTKTLPKPIKQKILLGVDALKLIGLSKKSKIVKDIISDDISGS